jgi:hypothetical protein
MQGAILFGTDAKRPPRRVIKLSEVQANRKVMRPDGDRVWRAGEPPPPPPHG